MNTLAKRPAAALLLAALLIGARAGAAIGCTLSNPAQDLKYLFPEMTSYREAVNDLSGRPDGKEVFGALRERLGSDLDPIYETFETPYTVYTVFKGEETLGVVHGVNVPGRGGVIQVFLSVDPASGDIRQMFFQRLESPAAKTLRKKDFRERFAGLSLADFYKHDYYAKAEPGSARDRVAAIPSPGNAEAVRTDFEATVRGVRKNLILLDVFVYGRRFEPFFKKAQEALAALTSGTGAAPGAGKAGDAAPDPADP